MEPSNISVEDLSPEEYKKGKYNINVLQQEQRKSDQNDI
jgi:hypothetical protein